MSSDDEVLSGGPASENEAVDVAVTAGATPPGPFGAPRSALAENIQRKGASNRRVWVGLCACPPFTRCCCCVGSNSYYYAHAGTLEKAPALSYDGAVRCVFTAVSIAGYWSPLFVCPLLTCTFGCSCPCACVYVMLVCSCVPVCDVGVCLHVGVIACL